MALSTEELATAEPDLLSDLLAPLRLRGVFASRWTARAPWGVRGDQEHNAIIHYVTTGTAAVVMPGTHEPVLLGPGDLVVFPHGTAHELVDQPGRRPAALDMLLPDRQTGICGTLAIEGPGPLTELLCGGLHYDLSAASPLYRALPDVLRLDAARLATEPLMGTTLRQLLEQPPAAPGSRLVCLRAFELVFVLALRIAVEQLADTIPIVRALHHPGISRALLAIQIRYAEPWTLETLAREAAMSRSAFASAFQELVGQTPIRHLTERRMTVAAQLIADSTAPLPTIAGQVGYRSAIGFHSAFRSFHGSTPGAYRRSGRA